MVEYIDKSEVLELKRDYGEGQYSMMLIDPALVKKLPTADVVEREKIDKAIDEIETVIKQWEHRVEIREKNSCYHDETNNYIALSNQLIGMEKILEILKRNMEVK